MKTKTAKQIIKEMNKEGMITPSQAEAQDTHAKDQAKAQLESITEMVKELNAANNDASTDNAAENRREEADGIIQDSPLSIEVCSNWHAVGEEKNLINNEFYFLLCTGGPAVRIIGSLDRNEPESARLEYQDWGTPWTEYRLTPDEEETVLTYCRCFYFGE